MFNPALLGLLMLFLPSVLARPLALITNQLNNSVSVIDITNGQKIQTLKLAPNPVGVAVSNSGAVITHSESRSLSQLTFDLQKGLFIPTEIDMTSVLQQGSLGVGHNHQAWFLTDWYGSALHKFSLSFKKPMTVKTGAEPAGVVVDDKWVYVASRQAHQIEIFSQEHLKKVKTISVEQRPFGIALDSLRHRLYVVNVGSNSVSIIDLNTLSLAQTLSTGELPYCAVVSHDGKRLFVTNQESETVSVFDTLSGKELVQIPVGDTPDGVDISKDDKWLVAVNWGEGSVSIIETEKYQVVYTVETGQGSRGFGRFIFDSTH